MGGDEGLRQGNRLLAGILVGLLLGAALWFPGSLGLVGKAIRSLSMELVGFAAYLIAHLFDAFIAATVSA